MGSLMQNETYDLVRFPSCKKNKWVSRLTEEDGGKKGISLDL